MVDFTTEQNLPFTFTVKDGRGRAVAVTGTPTAVTSDPTVATVDALTSTDNKTWSGMVNSVSPGTARVAVTADAEIIPGVENDVIGTLDCNVTLDPRSAERIIDLEAGAPVDKPA